MDNYDNLAEAYDAYGKTATTDWLLGYAYVISALEPLRGKIILDYGCGTGQFSRHLAGNALKVIGVDVHEEMIRKAESYSSVSIEYRFIQSGDLSFLASDSVDAAVLNFVTCTISSRTEICRILSAIIRVLRPNGVVTIMNANWDKSNGREFVSFRLHYAPDLASGQAVYVTLKNAVPLEITDYYWSVKEYIQMLYETGYHDLKVEEPIASDPVIPWIDEKEYPPFSMITGVKP